MANIAILGASGLVGSKLTEIIADKLPHHKLFLFGNSSVGQKVYLMGRPHIIRDTSEVLKGKFDYAMFMANDQVAAEYLPVLSARGTVSIDNSAYFRLQKDVPLVVPQINGEKIGLHTTVANPNCTTIQVAIALHALLPLEPSKATVATYQAVSGAGKEGLTDLEERRTYGKLKSFSHPIFDNVLPQIGKLTENGFTTEEMKMQNETRKILDLPHFCVNSFCARVPVTVGHCAFVNVKFKRPFQCEEVKNMLRAEKDLLLFDGEALPMPQNMRHGHLVGVGRVHKDSDGDGIDMVVVADNLLRGAAYNAYQILKISMQNHGDEN